MSVVNKLRGQVAFPLAGEGAFVQFSMNDLAALEEIYGEASYFEEIDKKINLGGINVIIKCFNIGLKIQVDDEVKKAPVDWDNQPFLPVECGPAIMDALCQSTVGKTYAEALQAAVDERTKQEEEVADALPEGGEVTDPFVGLKASEEPKQSDTVPDLDQPKSGD